LKGNLKGAFTFERGAKTSPRFLKEVVKRKLHLKGKYLKMSPKAFFEIFTFEREVEREVEREISASLPYPFVKYQFLCFSVFIPNPC